MRLLKEYIPQKLLGIGVLLDYRSVSTVSLSRHNAGGLGDEDLVVSIEPFSKMSPSCAVKSDSM